MTQRPVLGLMSFACFTLILSAALAALADDYWNPRLVAPDTPIVRCRFTGTKDSRATFKVVRVIYGDYARDTVELDASSLPWGAPRDGEVILYLARASGADGQPLSYSAYVWQNIDAEQQEATRVISAGEHIAPASDKNLLVMYFMNQPPNLVVRASLVSVDDKAAHWKLSKVLLPERAAAPRTESRLKSLGYLGSPEAVFPPPSAAPIPAAGDSIAVRLDAWTRRAETMVRYSDPDKPCAASAEAVAAKLKELASTELVPGREAVLFLKDAGHLGNKPAYDAIVVIPPAPAARGEIEKAERAAGEAADLKSRLRSL